ncbi:hypothetical protein ABPG72_008648 [Tetrahymena utriculariae]
MENIHVSLRLRPLNEKELRQNEKIAWEVIDQNTVQVVNDNIVNQTSRNVIQNTLTFNKQPSFHYDRCFAENISNKQVYENSVQSILKSSLNGVNGTIFMYGQSGSGKTYTMMGYEKKQSSQQSASQNPQLSIFNYQSNQTNQNQQRKRNSSQNYNQQNSCSPLTKNNSYLYSNQMQDIDDIDFDKIKSNTPDDNKGILMLALYDLFDTIKKDEDKTYVVRCSYVEIYNDQIYDLLNPVNKLNEILQVGMNQNKEFYIKGVTQESVSTLEEAYDVLKRGETNKHYAQTTMNHHSSRSHSIFKLYVQSISSVLLKSCLPKRSQNNIAQRNVNNQELLEKLNEHDSTLISTSELNFIDLAGSEKVSNHSNLEEIILNSGSKNQSSSNARDLSPQDLIKDRVKEGQFINKSLFFLTQVISQIAEGKPLTHIPYRNSPLTKILKSSLGGNSRTMIILCINPSQSQFEQSYSTIRFGLNAKKIENKVRVNIQAKNNEEALQLLILDYEKKMRELEQQRNEERTRNADLIKKLNELANQNSQIQQKLMNSNRKNIELSLTRTSNFEGICQNCQKSNQNSGGKIDKQKTSQKRENSNQKQKWLSEKQKELNSQTSLHCDYVGLLFPTQNNISVSDVCPQVKRNWQDLVFDYEGRYAFHQYQQRNKQFAAYLKMWDKVNINIDKVIEHHLRIYDCAQKMRDSLRNYEGSLENVVQKLKSQTMNIQNQSFQTQGGSLASFMVDLEQITLEELQSLEKTLVQAFEQVLQVKYRRSLKSNLDQSYKQNNLSTFEKQKFINLFQHENNFMVINYPESEKNKKLNDSKTNKNSSAQEEQICSQLDTSIDDIKRYLKENEGPKGLLQYIQNSHEQEREFVKQLFYRQVDVLFLSEANQIDWVEADFKHLKCIINKSTYSHLNIFNQPSSESDTNLANKKSAFLTPKVNKFGTNHQKINECDDEVEKKDQLSFDDDQINSKKNKPQLGYFSQSQQQNVFLTNNNSITTEEKLQYHQNPIPKAQEEEIQQNFEKLQNQSCLFDGCSTISNINSNYTPSNTSFNQNVIGSQKFMNTLTNQQNINGTMNVLQSNAPSNSNNNSNINFTNFNLPIQNNINLPNQGAINLKQSPLIVNFLSHQAFQKQSKQIDSSSKLQLQNLPQNNQSSSFVNVLQDNQQLGQKQIYFTAQNIDEYSEKNPLSSLKQNTSSIPDSINSLNINLIENCKQNNLLEYSTSTQNYLPKTQVNISNHQRSQSFNEATSNSKNKLDSSQKNDNIGSNMYYIGHATSNNQAQKMDTFDKYDNQNNYHRVSNSNSAISSNPSSILQQKNSNFQESQFKEKLAPTVSQLRNFERQPLDNIKNNSIQSFENLLKQQEVALTNQADLLTQQFIGSQHKRAQSNIITTKAINLNSQSFNVSQINNTNQKVNGAESLQKDESPESLQNFKSQGNIQHTKSFQKIIGNISKGSSILPENSSNRENQLNTHSNSQQKYSINLSTLHNQSSNAYSSNQNCQSVNATPKKQAYKLNNTISIDIIQLQSNQPIPSKPFNNHNKQIQSNNFMSNNSLLIQDNQLSSNRKQSSSLHSTASNIDKINKNQYFTNMPSQNYSLNNSITSNYLSANNSYNTVSNLNQINNKNCICFDENNLQQISQKPSSLQNKN